MTIQRQSLGILTDVLQTGANDVYVVETDEGKGDPASRDSVLHPGGRSWRMDGCCVHVPEGLL